jgi:RNA polymerase sigma factor (sigma-70 family)
MWSLLNSVLLRDLRSQVHRLGSVPHEEILDIAADKSLELVRRSEAQQWKLEGKSPEEIAGFLRTVARNGLVDSLRRSGREVQVESDAVPRDRIAGQSTPVDPEAQLELKEFSLSLRDCVGQIQTRSRLIWFLRVFLSMSGQEIARHPGVGLSRNHADMVLHRAREAIRKCMQRGGYDADVPRNGSLATLWEIFSSELKALDHRHE